MIKQSIKRIDFIYDIIAILIVWGATAYHYINTGMSIACIAFILFLGYSRYKKIGIKNFCMDKDILRALGYVYGLLLFTTLFHLDNMKNLYGGWYCLVGFVLYTLPMWMILYVGWDKDIRKSITITFSVISYALCLVGIYQCLFLHVGRLHSFYTSPTHVGIMLDMFIPFTITLAVYYKNKRSICISMIFLLFLELISLYLTETRGSFLALSVALVGIIITAFFKYREKFLAYRKIVTLLAAVFIVLGCIYCVSLGSGDPHRMWGEERFLMWETSYHMWEDHKIVGMGLDEWKSSYEGAYRPAESKEVGYLTMPHNMLFYFLATSGIVGTFGYILYCIFMTKYFWGNISLFKDNPFSWGMFAIFIAFIVHGMVDATFISKSMSRIFFLFLGISILFERYGIERK